MNKVLVILTFFSFVLLAACKNDPAATGNNPNAAAGPVEHANPVNLAGHWITLDFCARAHQYGSILKAMNNVHLPYAYAFSFTPDQPDSVTCYNGAKAFKLAAKINVDTIELMNAKDGKPVYLVYDPVGKEMSMFDGTSGQSRMDRLVKSKANSPNGYLAFTTALNHNLFEGNFFPAGKNVEKPVQFSPGGYIMNFADYDRYAPCTGGDCFILGDQMDVITFASTKVQNSQKQFGFKFSSKSDTLTFYNLNMGAAGTAATIGAPAYRFIRKSVDEKLPAGTAPAGKKK